MASPLGLECMYGVGGLVGTNLIPGGEILPEDAWSLRAPALFFCALSPLPDFRH